MNININFAFDNQSIYYRLKAFSCAVILLVFNILNISFAQGVDLGDSLEFRPAQKVGGCPDNLSKKDCRKYLKLLKETNAKNNLLNGVSGVAQSPSGSAPAPVNSQSLIMYSGEVLVLDFTKIDRVAIGSGKVAATTVLDTSRLLIIAQDVGDTNILVWNKSQLVREIKLRVTAQNLSRIVGEARNLLASIPGLKINTVGDRIFIEGSDLSESELSKVKSLASQYPGVVDRTVGKYKGTLTTDPSAMVMLDLYFVEFKKSYLQNLGVAWKKNIDGLNVGVYGRASRGPSVYEPNINDGFDPGFVPNKLRNVNIMANIIANIPGVINLAVDSGDAILLAAPKISARSGGKANFKAGGEVPLPSTSNQGTKVEFKSYGVLLEVEPQINGDGSISGLVRAEVSAIDPALTVLGIPGFLTRRTEADFFSQDGEAVVLSGLYSQDLSKSVDKIPLLGDIPLLGALFSNSGEIRKNSELVVFIVPHLYSAKSELNQQLLRNTKAIVDEQTKILGGDGTDYLLKLKPSSKLWGTGVLENIKPDRIGDFRPAKKQDVELIRSVDH